MFCIFCYLNLYQISKNDSTVTHYPLPPTNTHLPTLKTRNNNFLFISSTASNGEQNEAIRCHLFFAILLVSFDHQLHLHVLYIRQLFFRPFIYCRNYRYFISTQPKRVSLFFFFLDYSELMAGLIICVVNLTVLLAIPAAWVLDYIGTELYPSLL